MPEMFGLSSPETSNSVLSQAHLDALMARTTGSPEIAIGLLDGPVDLGHPALVVDRFRNLRQLESGVGQGMACSHGTFIAGILAAERGSKAPAICPTCTLVSCAIFDEAPDNGELPATSAGTVAAAINDVMAAGARIINLSAAVASPGSAADIRLVDALDRAAARGVLVVAAAGNQNYLGASVVTGHPWVIPVVAYGRNGRPLSSSNLGASIGRHGLGAPGEAVLSLDCGGGTRIGHGTSAATAVVTGALALTWSVVPQVSAWDLKSALSGQSRRRSITPPLLNAEHVFLRLAALNREARAR